MDVAKESCVPIGSLRWRGGHTRWWPVALSEQVTGVSPLGVVCDGEPIVLFRDTRGQARALEDRCRHRRAPLSLGRITVDGRIQCGYHGWTYEGLSGVCTAIPHLSANEVVPSHYAARAWRVAECGGFVYVAAQEISEDEPREADLLQWGEGRRFRGGVTVATPYDEYVAALADGPQLLMRFPLLTITNYVSVDPTERDGCVAIERGVVWAARRRNHRFMTDYPWTLRLACVSGGATMLVELYTRDEELALAAAVALAPSARGATAVYWRGGVSGAAGGLGAVLLRAWWHLGQAPFGMLPHVDGHALARLERLYSPAWLQHWQEAGLARAADRAESAPALRNGRTDDQYRV